VLAELCRQASARSQTLKGRLAEFRRDAEEVAAAPSLIDALGRGRSVHVIAEIKRRSPSKGTINDTLDAGRRACEYVSGGASAISVLTEPESFGGSADDLVTVRRAVVVPVLKKDFHVSDVQVWEAKALGASAILLIVRALGPERVAELSATARMARIETLFEVRDESELDWALDAGARLIGVNRRDLETLSLENDVPARILPLIPPTCVAVAESGISDRSSVIEAAAYGADAVLVGSSLSSSVSAEAAVRALSGVERRGRTGG
jgi:indole-3-glycerol phosphate synthase